MAGVFLGLPGPWANDNRELSDHYTSKIGGLPDWPPLPEDGLRPELLDCSSCGNRLCLVAQVYAPIVKTEERTIYVLGCLMPKCGTNPCSWRALRVQKLSNEDKSNGSCEEEAYVATSSASESNGTQDDLDFEDNDDIDLESLCKALVEAATIASEKKKESKKESKRGSGTKSKPSPLVPKTRFLDDRTPVLPCFYVYAQEESLLKIIPSVCVDYKLPNEGEAQGEVWKEENYEYDRALGADRVYLKFKKRLDACAEQCFRYCYGGKPLLATKEGGPPKRCGICGAPRHYEMQLMPPVIYFLQEVAEEGQKHSLNNWDWLTLIVYSCSKSCSQSVNEDDEVIYGGWVVAEEAVSVQFDDPINADQLSYFS